MSKQIHGNHIVFDDAQFKKVAKRLQSYFNEDQTKPIKLNVAYETLSKALGFRNYDALNSFFHKNHQPSHAYIIQKEFLHHLSEHEIINIFSYLIDISASQMLKNRTLGLMTITIKLLIWMRENGEVLFSSGLIKEYLKLSLLFKLYKTRRDMPSDLRNELLHYLQSLPGFQESAPLQSGQVIEQHGYLQTQLDYPLSLVHKLEEKNPLLLSASWLEVIYQTNKNSPLDNDSLLKLYSEYKFVDWNSIFEPSSKINNSYPIKNFDFNQKIKQSSSYIDSWLTDTDFLEIVFSLLKNKQLKDLYLSDILLYSLKIINREKKQTVQRCFYNLIQNYENIVATSEELNRLI